MTLEAIATECIMEGFYAEICGDEKVVKFFDKTTDEYCGWRYLL